MKRVSVWVMGLYFVGLTFVHPVFAEEVGWNQDSRLWIERFKMTSSFWGGDEMNLWAAIQGQKWVKSTHEVLPLRVMNSHFKQQSEDVAQPSAMSAEISLRKNPQGEVLVRPLVVFLPGIFGGLKSPAAMRNTALLASQGYHVLILPNPWSLDYIEHHPNQPPGNPEEEAVALLESIASVKKNWPNAFTKTHLMGESYGGFLSFIIAAKDSVDNYAHPIIDGEVFIFSPPVDLQASMAHIDLDFQRPKESGCMSWWTLLVDFLPELKRVTPGVPFSANLKRCMKTVLTEASHEMFVKSVKKWHEISCQGKVPSRWCHPFQYSDWKSNLTFEKYRNEYNADVEGAFSDQDVRRSAAYWLQQTQFETRKKIKILSTQDDFLNLDSKLSQKSTPFISVISKWQPVSEALIDPDRQLAILPWGGHVAYFELPDFEDFLKSTFPSMTH